MSGGLFFVFIATIPIRIVKTPAPRKEKLQAEQTCGVKEGHCGLGLIMQPGFRFTSFACRRSCAVISLRCKGAKNQPRHRNANENIDMARSESDDRKIEQKRAEKGPRVNTPKLAAQRYVLLLSLEGAWKSSRKRDRSLGDAARTIRQPQTLP